MILKPPRSTMSAAKLGLNLNRVARHEVGIEKDTLFTFRRSMDLNLGLRTFSLSCSLLRRLKDAKGIGVHQEALRFGIGRQGCHGSPCRASIGMYCMVDVGGEVRRLPLSQRFRAQTR